MSRVYCGRRRSAKLTLASLLVAGGMLFAGSPAQAGAVEALKTKLVAGGPGGGLTLPIYATHAPGDTKRLFIVEKTGRIKILNLTTNPPTLLATPFLNIDDRVIDVAGGSAFTQENFGKGIMGMAFDPAYATNGYFYVHYYQPDTRGVISRYSVTADPNVAGHDSESIVWRWTDPQGEHHNGGSIDFGPDGFLYITLGDGGTQFDPENDAQNLNSMFGKIHRIDVHGLDAYPADPDRNYAIPAGNPFAGGGGLPEILHHGLRNPFRASFDSGTGRYYIGDVGQGAREEIDVVPPGVTGLNFGWKCSEGLVCPTTFAAGVCACGPGLTLPIHDYLDASFGRSITVGYVYRGCAIPTLRGKLVFGDYTSGNFWRLTYDGVAASAVTLLNSQFSPSLDGIAVNRPAAFGEDGRGELYIVVHATGVTSPGGTTSTLGAVYKIVPATPTIALADLNCDEVVNGLDLASLLAAWGRCPLFSCVADLNGDGTVNGFDLATLLAGWG